MPAPASYWAAEVTRVFSPSEDVLRTPSTRLLGRSSTASASDGGTLWLSSR